MWYKLITQFYKASRWTLEQVKRAVELGKISKEQYKEITGEDYVAE